MAYKEKTKTNKMKKDKYLYSQVYNQGFAEWYKRPDGSFYQRVFIFDKNNNAVEKTGKPITY